MWRLWKFTRMMPRLKAIIYQERLDTWIAFSGTADVTERPDRSFSQDRKMKYWRAYVQGERGRI